MKATTREIRFNLGSFLEAIDRGEEVEITFRGRVRALLTPPKRRKKTLQQEDPFFGIWEDRTDLEDPVAYVREIRKPRRFEDLEP